VSKKAVLLVNPRMCAPHSTRLPLSVLNLGAVLDGRHPWRIVDGNLHADASVRVLAALAEEPHALLGVTVMPGPQVATAIEISVAVRAAFPQVPIVWGGYFPTLYPDSAINAPYVDYLVRGQGEATLLDLLARLPDAGPPTLFDSARDSSALRAIGGLTFKEGGRPVHNPARNILPAGTLPPLPYERVDVASYLRPSFLGSRTAVDQGALGCRFRCEFCGVASMWNGHTHLEGPERLRHALTTLRDGWGADGVQFYDHNFFDTEDNSQATLDVLAELGMPWWCYARADTLARFSAASWAKIKRSRLRMTYIGAETASDEVLNRMRKGSRVDHTTEVVRRCQENDVIPELSFVLGGPDDPEGEIEKTFTFIRHIKTINPRSEIILYFYSPTPQVDRSLLRRDPTGVNLPRLATYGPSGPRLPDSPEGWTTPRWLAYVCHQDAPWLTPRLRSKVADFAQVLACRFPTVQDTGVPRLGKTVLRELARWRYSSRRYQNPFELRLAQRLFKLRDPKSESL
jgi:anaerobic magnesium-protoporphyrin IX monomethyl ester cyclase